MDQRRLTHSAILKPGESVHFARSVLDRKRPGALHDHDYFELFWVQNGRVRHHLQGGRQDLSEGDMVFIRPSDAHGLQSRADETHIVNVIIHPDLIEELGARHPQLQGRFFWSAAARPVTLTRDVRQMPELARAALRLERGGRDRLAAEGFLLPLLGDLAADPVALPDDAPDWLARACVAALDQRVFRDGASGFARAAGKAHAHVSRTARKYLGKSPSEYVNGIRMDFAARALAGTGDSLQDIAADCGIPNLSHFHRLFRAHFGTTPQHYRRAHQRDLIQPGKA